MADDPTPGEVTRRLEDVRVDLKEDVRDVHTRLDTKVSAERYQLEQQAALERERSLTERVKALETARQREVEERRQDEQRQAERRAVDRRLAFTALVAPVLILILNLYLNSRGAR
ncbi:hypothetical protein AQ490_23160 [Wenjunlia vitaminophila]|uniref:Uncharacterized protein n=1 Tax=Wenjunlia vitaminophila TaxID=76728 RepID=A0A0T6LRV0_WENVI|nr:hypothetical protein [Wenjunlia vitaminophila]KRV48773.1 hypothetical protein AQ490_23160 [Wenjunlia vitaminophila]